MIFTWYRRADSAAFAGRIADFLENRFKDIPVFLDVASIDPGEDFKEAIARKLGTSKVVLMIIGDRWLERDAHGKRRIDDPNDFVRHELETALSLKLRIIPVLLDDAVMPSEDDLPEDLKPLAILICETPSEHFVQFAKARGGQVQFDLPSEGLTAQEMINAQQLFAETYRSHVNQRGDQFSLQLTLPLEPIFLIFLNVHFRERIQDHAVWTIENYYGYLLLAPSCGQRIDVSGDIPMPVITFEQALAETAAVKRHLLLGNGFSIALFPGRFSYASLLGATDFTNYPEAYEAFNLLGTTDFEVVINALQKAAILLPPYGDDGAALAKMQDHANALKELLVQAIARRHPERPGDINDQQYRACREFLVHFIGESRKGTSDLRGSIFTLNYDLLLYWTLMHDRLLIEHPDFPGFLKEEAAEPLETDDGCRVPDEDLDAEYVTWDAESSHVQNIYFLHGALHLFDYGAELQKKCWERSGGTPLIDQIRAALNEGRFPLFVSEGRSSGKLDRILHSTYLAKCLRYFRSACDQIKAALFVFGHSLAENDAHVLRQIERGKITHLFISLYGDPENETNRAIVTRAELMRNKRSERYPLEVSFYDAASVHVWS